MGHPNPASSAPESLIYRTGLGGRGIRSGFTASDGMRSARDLVTLHNAVEQLGRRFKPAALFLMFARFGLQASGGWGVVWVILAKTKSDVLQLGRGYNPS